MTRQLLSPLRLETDRPSPIAGVVAAVLSVAAATAVIYPLKTVAPVVSLGVVYLLGVVVVSTLWGLAFGVGTAVLSAAAFNFFHLPPVGYFTLSDSRNWVALSAFVVVAVATGLVSELARSRAREAGERRREADAAAELARLLLGAARLEDALPLAAQQLAAVLGVQSAAIETREVAGDERSMAFALHSEGERVGTLLLPASLSASEAERVRHRIVPALESILAAAARRQELQEEVVETAALRRSDELKTAVLRSVSHDLRTPLTAILTAASALDDVQPSAENVRDVKEVVSESATRLWRLIDQLLDLSLLQAGTAEPRLEWYSIQEVLEEAIEHVQAPPETFHVAFGPEMPLLRGDSGQLERGFANILENAVRHSAGKPVAVRARSVGQRIRVRIVDQGPGIPPREQERIFIPFYRAAAGRDGHQGAGLGLAIAKGFIELNGGSIGVESLPGQGTTFVIEFALPQGVPEREPIVADAR